tara:strand:- start:574 stop:1044 length:471 start_codon:yes stop_codon:yes gene_type:complete
MKQFILNESESIWNILPDGEDCIELTNNTERQVWFIVLPSEQCDGIVVFKGKQDNVDHRFNDQLNPKLPHALRFNEKEGPAMKRILWDSEQPLTIVRVINKGSIIVIGGFGQKATCKTCKRYEEKTGVKGITAHPIYSLPPIEFVVDFNPATNLNG